MLCTLETLLPQSCCLFKWTVMCSCSCVSTAQATRWSRTPDALEPTCRLYTGGAAGSETSRWPGWLYVYSCPAHASPRQDSGSCTSLFWWPSPLGAGLGRKVWRARWAAPERQARSRPARCTWPRGQRPWPVCLRGWSAGSWWHPQGAA